MSSRRSMRPNIGKKPEKYGHDSLDDDGYLSKNKEEDIEFKIRNLSISSSVTRSERVLRSSMSKNPKLIHEENLKFILQKSQAENVWSIRRRSTPKTSSKKVPTKEIYQKKYVEEPSEESCEFSDEDYEANSDEDDEDSDSENDEENEESAEDEIEEYEEEKIVPRRKLRPGKSLAGRSKESNYAEHCIQGESYFESSSRKVHTSNRTLDRLKNPRLDPKTLRKLTEKHIHLSEKHAQCYKDLFKKCRDDFPLWQFALEEGFSVLLYGLGSKREVLYDFYTTMVSDHPAVFINGFFPSLTIKEILDVIMAEVLEMEAVPKMEDCLKIIKSTLRKNPEDRLYLVINNIDGPQLRNSKMQDFFSRLAAIPNLHLVASVDHINSPLLWDNVKRSRFNFFWCDATTFLPYLEETSYESSMLVDHGGALALASLESVFCSLTPNAQKLYIILGKYQLENGGTANYPGMSFKKLYQKGRENFVASSDSVLRALLTEYKDHHLVKSKRGTDGIEYLSVPLEKDTLRHFVDTRESA